MDLLPFPLLLPAAAVQDLQSGHPSLVPLYRLVPA